MKYLLLVQLIILVHTVDAQIVNTAIMDTTDQQLKGRITVEGYLDAYYAYNFNKPQSKDQPYFVSMSRHNEMNINLAFVDAKFSSARVRARIAPGFGTYINANYSSEPGTLKNFIEANVGYKLSSRKNIWVDAGILGSPYTNESAISKDHLAYTRSFAAENVPYYLSGVKLSATLTDKTNFYLYLINGWQQITDQNSNKSIGTQVEVRPNKNLLINWNTYIGNERSAIDSLEGARYFTDLYFIYQRNAWSVTSSVYFGIQEALGEKRTWGQANLIARYAITSVLSVSGRAEYFEDARGVMLVPITGIRGFKTFSGSLGINLSPERTLLFRTEARYLFADNDLYLKIKKPTHSSLILSTSIAIWF